MKMNIKGNDCFQTPKYLFNQLNEIFNFEKDICCTTENCLCDDGFYFDKGFDALNENWQGRCFCNPPFSKKAEFIKKASEEIEKENCHVVVMILPSNCTDCKAFHDYIYKKHHFEILKGRVSFIDPETKKPNSGNNSGTMIVYFKKNIKIMKEK